MRVNFVFWKILKLIEILNRIDEKKKKLYSLIELIKGYIYKSLRENGLMLGVWKIT